MTDERTSTRRILGLETVTLAVTSQDGRWWALWDHSGPESVHVSQLQCGLAIAPQLGPPVALIREIGLGQVRVQHGNRVPEAGTERMWR